MQGMDIGIDNGSQNLFRITSNAIADLFLRPRVYVK